MDIKYIQLFPYEVLEHICSFLTTGDIIKLSEIVTEFENVTDSKRIISKTNLFCEYHVTRNHIVSFLSSKPKCDFITSLNLSCIYWVPAADLRKCISSLQNLESLYVVDTKMGLLKPDLLTYSKILKLNKLGLSVTKRTFCRESLKYFPKLTHFYLHLDSDADVILRPLMFILNRQDCLEEFWLIESGTVCCTNLACVTVPLSVVKFCSLLHNIFFSNKDVCQLERVHRSMFTKMESCWERRQPVKRFANLNLGEEWTTFFDLSRTNMPFTPKQTKEIIEKESLDGINFDEINFAHDTTICGGTFKKTAENLLMYDSMRSLKKLGINFCAGICDDKMDDEHPNVKRQKCDNPCLIQRISENSPKIEELEIWSCTRVEACQKITNNSCNAIVNFKYLRKLTLDDLPIHINGSFLINVFMLCSHLSSLRLRSRQQNTSLHNMLCLALKHATALKDLRYEHPCNISVDKLFTALIENKKLINIERLFIKCKSVEILSSKSFHKLLEVSPNLKLLYLVINELPKTAIKQMMKSLDKYTDDPRKIFVITNSEYSYNGRVQIPFIHIYEMVMCHTHVSCLDVFNGYV